MKSASSLHETGIQNFCKRSLIRGELFTKDGLDIFLTTASQLGLDHCRSSDFDERALRLQRKRLNRLTKENADLTKRLTEQSTEITKFKEQSRALASEKITLLDHINTLQHAQKQTQGHLCSASPQRDIRDFFCNSQPGELLDNSHPDYDTQYVITLREGCRTEYLNVLPVFELWCKNTGQDKTKRDLNKAQSVWQQLGLRIVDRMKLIKPCPTPPCTHTGHVKHVHGQWNRDVVIGLQLVSRVVAKSGLSIR